MREPELRIHDTPSALAADVAERLLVVIRDAQAAGRVPAICLTGGTIADTIHSVVAAAAAHAGIDWRRVAFWWGDERFVAADSTDRNAVQARTALLDSLDLDPALVHEVPSVESAGSVDEAAAAYGDLVRAEGGGEFDVVMLGMGPDGHVASLFPGFPQLTVDDTIAVGVTGSPKPPPERVSLTFAALNRTRATWLVVSGEAKAAAVAAALTSSEPATAAEIAEIPARGVSGTRETVWFLDSPAASALP
ncbi:MAG: 6-phosphogluconolactonase [Nocardioidaceae bacterium]|nr:6-phosphogluconolactonase [Nocardioidaceae bacterium]